MCTTMGLAGRSVNIRTADSFTLARSERDYLFDKADKPVQSHFFTRS